MPSKPIYILALINMSLLFIIRFQYTTVINRIINQDNTDHIIKTICFSISSIILYQTKETDCYTTLLNYLVVGLHSTIVIYVK
jgi:hypothetical protein